MEEKHKVWCQQHHCEALAQLAVHDDSREALLRDGSVIPALEAVSKSGLCEKARELAAAALVALSDKKLEMLTDGQKHVMLSCESSLHVLQRACSFFKVAATAHGMCVTRDPCLT